MSLFVVPRDAAAAARLQPWLAEALLGSGFIQRRFADLGGPPELDRGFVDGAGFSAGLKRRLPRVSDLRGLEDAVRAAQQSPAEPDADCELARVDQSPRRDELLEQLRLRGVVRLLEFVRGRGSRCCGVALAIPAGGGLDADIQAALPAAACLRVAVRLLPSGERVGVAAEERRPDGSWVLRGASVLAEARRALEQRGAALADDAAAPPDVCLPSSATTCEVPLPLLRPASPPPPPAAAAVSRHAQPAEQAVLRVQAAVTQRLRGRPAAEVAYRLAVPARLRRQTARRAEALGVGGLLAPVPGPAAAAVVVVVAACGAAVPRDPRIVEIRVDDEPVDVAVEPDAEADRQLTALRCEPEPAPGAADEWLVGSYVRALNGDSSATTGVVGCLRAGGVAVVRASNAATGARMQRALRAAADGAFGVAALLGGTEPADELEREQRQAGLLPRDLSGPLLLVVADDGWGVEWPPTVRFVDLRLVRPTARELGRCPGATVLTLPGAVPAGARARGARCPDLGVHLVALAQLRDADAPPVFFFSPAEAEAEERLLGGAEAPADAPFARFPPLWLGFVGDESERLAALRRACAAEEPDWTAALFRILGVEHMSRTHHRAFAQWQARWRGSPRPLRPESGDVVVDAAALRAALHWEGAPAAPLPTGAVGASWPAPGRPFFAAPLGPPTAPAATLREYPGGFALSAPPDAPTPAVFVPLTSAAPLLDYSRALARPVCAVVREADWPKFSQLQGRMHVLRVPDGAGGLHRGAQQFAARELGLQWAWLLHDRVRDCLRAADGDAFPRPCAWDDAMGAVEQAVDETDAGVVGVAVDTALWGRRALTVAPAPGLMAYVNVGLTAARGALYPPDGDAAVFAHIVADAGMASLTYTRAFAVPAAPSAPAASRLRLQPRIDADCPEVRLAPVVAAGDGVQAVDMGAVLERVEPDVLVRPGSGSGVGDIRPWLDLVAGVPCLVAAGELELSIGERLTPAAMHRVLAAPPPAVVVAVTAPGDVASAIDALVLRQLPAATVVYVLVAGGAARPNAPLARHVLRPESPWFVQRAYAAGAFADVTSARRVVGAGGFAVLVLRSSRARAVAAADAGAAVDSDAAAAAAAESDGGADDISLTASSSSSRKTGTRGWDLFRKERFKSGAHGDLSRSERQAVIGREWKALSPMAQLEYNQRAKSIAVPPPGGSTPGDGVAAGVEKRKAWDAFRNERTRAGAHADVTHQERTARLGREWAALGAEERERYVGAGAVSSPERRRRPRPPPAKRKRRAVKTGTRGWDLFRMEQTRAGVFAELGRRERLSELGRAWTSLGDAERQEFSRRAAALADSSSGDEASNVPGFGRSPSPQGSKRARVGSPPALAPDD